MPDAPRKTQAEYQADYRERRRAGESPLRVRSISAVARARLDNLKRPGETDKAALERVLTDLT